MRFRWRLVAAFLVIVLGGLALAFFVGGAVGALGGLVAAFAILLVAGGLSGRRRSYDYHGGRRWPE